MIEQGLVKTNFVGRDGFIWWIGQIASDSWKMNIPGSQPGDVPLDAQEGFGYRYQVRIMGYHTADGNELPDNDLPWASVMYPVTAGGNAGSAGATPNIRKGNFVYGFFIDGDDAQQPVIMGILGFNQYTNIFKDSENIPPFAPFLGYSPNVPSYTIKSGSGSDGCKKPKKLTEEEQKKVVGPKSGQWRKKDTKRGARYSTWDGTKWSGWSTARPQGGSQYIKPSKPIGTLEQGSTGGQGTASKNKSLKQGIKKRNMPSPYSCKNSRSAKGVQLQIQNLIQSIQNAQKALKCWKANQLNATYDSITKSILDTQQYAQKKLTEAAEQIAGFMRDQIAAVETFITKKIQSALKKLYFMLFPTQQQTVADAVDTAMDLLACHFKRIANNLFKMIFKALTGIVDRWINVPLCAAESIIGAILGKLMGLINGIVNAIMGPLDAIFSALGSAVDIVGGVLEIIEDILSWLSCDTAPECPTIDNWSVWLGTDPESTTIDFQNIISKVEEFSSNISDVVDPDNFDFDLDVDFSDIFDLNQCNTNPLVCGPPRAVFWGGSGDGASGNVIVSALGDILGVDIINSGTKYDEKAPFLTFVDDCGKGYNGSGTVVTGPVSEGDSGEWFSDPNGTEIGVVGVNINDSGFGYLPTPDGSLGGDGRTWSEYDQTTVRHVDGTWDAPYDGGEVVPGYSGDTIRVPVGCTAEFTCMDGTVHTVYGGSNYKTPCDGVLTAPSGCADTSGRGDYAAMLYICEVEIVNPGFDYEDGDEVVITPDVGAVILPTFGPFGNLVKLELIDGGEGFKEFPTITIDSETGFNAEIRPRLCIDRITDELKVPEVQDKIVSVVDCVGKI